MNLRILTTGPITSKFGIRPALMYAKDRLAQHVVVRIVAGETSGLIGILNCQVITGAKCRKAEETLDGFEAMAEFLTLRTGVFELIQLDSKLPDDELAQSVEISLDALLQELKTASTLPPLELLHRIQPASDSTQPDYQSSLVLRDLENAIYKSRENLSASGAFSRLPETVEMMKIDLSAPAPINFSETEQTEQTEPNSPDCLYHRRCGDGRRTFMGNSWQSAGNQSHSQNVLHHHDQSV